MTNDELNRWIAENVMGLDVANICGDLLYCKPPTRGFTIPVPNYCGDIKAAFEVVRKMEEQMGGCCFEFNLTKSETNVSTGWKCRFEHEEAYWDATADTAPMAICLSARKAVEDV